MCAGMYMNMRFVYSDHIYPSDSNKIRQAFTKKNQQFPKLYASVPILPLQWRNNEHDSVFDR